MPQVIDIRKIKKTSKKAAAPTETPAKIEWTAPEFAKHKKGKSWFVLSGIIALAVIVIAILTKNFLLAIATVLAYLVVRIYAQKKPRKIKFGISGKGVQIDQAIYRFEDLKSFWIFYEPPEIKELSLRSKKTFMPYIKIPLDKQNPVEIRKFLLRFLPERRHAESVMDEWMRKAKF